MIRSKLYRFCYNISTMNANEIESRLKQMVIDHLFLSVTPEELSSTASLIDDYGVDSVALLELVVGLEEEFGIVVEDGDFDISNFSSVKSLADFVAKRLA